MVSPLRTAVIIRQFGGPEVLAIENEPIAAPAAGEVRIRQTAIGFNYIDVYQRKGTYPLPLPSGLGHEAAGVVESLGAGVQSIKAGDRVAYMNAGVGAYTDARNVAADKLVPLPASVSDEAAATLLFKGMTAQYLLRRTHKVQSGELLLVHSAAGGVGQILTRWAKALGAVVIGTTSSEHKIDIAKSAGCDGVVNTSDPNWPKEFLKLSGGQKARVVYDAVGKDTFLGSLDCTAPFGLVAYYGAASGPAPAIEPDLLNKKGCLFLTRPSVFPHNADRDTFRANAADLFHAIALGQVKVDIGQRFMLAEIAQAHEMAEQRKTNGAVLITP